MSEWQVSLISVWVGGILGIVGSLLGSWLSHRWEWKRRHIEENLRWLEERYQPALEFLGELIADLATQRPLDSTDLHKIQGRVEQSARRAWPYALRLDPEDTGLRDLVLDALTYARISQSREEFFEYMTRVLMSFQTLSTVFREEREEILSGKSLKSLIQKRVQRRKEEQQRFQQLLSALEGFKEGKYSTEQTIRFVEKSYIRGTLLQFLLDLIEQRAHNTDRIASLKKKCRDYGWI